VCEDIERVPGQGVDDRQSVDLILQQRRYCIVQTVTESFRKDQVNVILDTACYDGR